MELGDLPTWAQQVGAFILTIATATGLSWAEKRKRRSAEAEPPRGDGVVLSATMADSTALRELIGAVRTMDGTLRELGVEMRRNTDETHDLTKNVVAIRGIMERYEALRTGMSKP